MDISALSVDPLNTTNNKPNEEVWWYLLTKKQLNNMFNLVEEFLDKFEERKPTKNLFSHLI